MEEDLKYSDGLKLLNLIISGSGLLVDMVKVKLEDLKANTVFGNYDVSDEAAHEKRTKTRCA